MQHALFAIGQLSEKAQEALNSQRKSHFFTMDAILNWAAIFNFFYQ
jgi:hypothetical protein